MSGMGAAMAGGNPKSGAQQEDGFYPTPWEATQALLNVEKFEGIIHEPCCGDGAMAKVLIANGYTVKSSDKVNRGFGVQRDFFTVTKPVAHNIVTNPPFEIKAITEEVLGQKKKRIVTPGITAEDFILHGLTLQPRKMAFLLKSTFWHAAKRKKTFEAHRPRWIYPLTWRLDFLGGGSPVMELSWFVWHRGNTEYPQTRLLDKPTVFPVASLEKLAI